MKTNHRIGKEAGCRPGRGYPPRLPALSADGRFVTFLSNAETPAPGFDNPGHVDQVVLYDRVAGTSTLVTASAAATGQGAQGSATRPAITLDGRWVAFTGYAQDLLPGTAAGRFPVQPDAVEGGRVGRLTPALSLLPLAVVVDFLGCVFRRDAPSPSTTPCAGHGDGGTSPPEGRELPLRAC